MKERFSNLFRNTGRFETIESRSAKLDAMFAKDGEWVFGQRDCSESAKTAAMIDKILRKPDRQDVFISTVHHFYGDHDYSWLAFSPRLQDNADEFLRQFGKHCIGVHIRRTDHVKSRAHSPIWLFIDAMQAEVDRDDQVRFFLATDSDVVRRVLVARFGSRMITRKGGVSRFDPGGISDGVVDLMLLSRTDRIYGSYWSSFSNEAARIGGIECTSLCDSWQDPELKIAELNDSVCDAMLTNAEVEERLRGAEMEVLAIKRSTSYRIGMFVTWPARRASRMFKCYRENGLKYTLRRLILGKGRGR